MGTVTYRLFSEGDAEAVQAVAREAWHHAYPHLFSPEVMDDYIDRHYAPEGLRALMPAIRRGDVSFWVAVDETEVVGFCHIRLTERGAELFRIYLLPSYVGQRIGRKLLEMGEAFLTARGVTRYFCFVNKGNLLGQQFYRKRGFYHVAENDLSDSYYMEKVLPQRKP
jgi:ribosomal protein S18 acetylase RimI-like enzyme